MPKLERPKKGDPITAEWAQAIYDEIQVLKQGPEVVAPLARLDGAISFGDNYLLYSVKTTTTISARIGNMMGSGMVQFYSADHYTLSAAGGFSTVEVVSKFGQSIPSGTYGVVAWIDEQWELISADCSGVA